MKTDKEDKYAQIHKKGHISGVGKFCHKCYSHFDKDISEAIKESRRHAIEEVFDNIKFSCEELNNPCMKCGSVQCAVCYDDLVKLKQSLLRGEKVQE